MYAETGYLHVEFGSECEFRKTERVCQGHAKTFNPSKPFEETVAVTKPLASPVEGRYVAWAFSSDPASVYVGFPCDQNA